jgi:hypothetical protein
MILFASPQAYRRLLDAALAGGVRWFHEPGAWVERRPLPRAPVARPRGARNPLPARLRWTRNG